MLSELRDSWAGIESGDPSVAWLRNRLAHYRALCEDRRGLYSITEKERLLHAKCKECEMSDPEPHASERSNLWTTRPSGALS
jgi:hypothetical protein